MHEEVKLLPDIVVLLAAAVIVVALFRQLRLSPVLGFLFAGAAIGPYGLQFITASEEKSYIAEFGVVFLLFMIGLELSLRRLAEMRSYVLGLGGLQLVITGGLLTVMVNMIVHNWHVAIVIGGALALSSTAIVLQVLEERGERLSQVGRVSFSVLLLQDLAVIPLLILVPILAGHGGDLAAELGRTVQNAVLVVFGMIIFGRFLLRPILAMIASTKSSELFVATTLLVSLGAAYATEHFGLSLAMGAFLAGLMVAETDFRKQVEADIMPFKGLLMGLFFMTIGMSFNFRELIDHLPLVLLYSVVLIALKAVVMIALCRLFKLNWETTLRSSLLMAQGGEFAFILFSLAAEETLLDKQTSEMLLLVVTFTMALTPLMYAIVNKIFKRTARKAPEHDDIQHTEDLQNHFIICGYGWVGENLAKFLATDHIKFVAIDSEPHRVKYGREQGMPVYYGDSARVEILRSMQADKAKGVIVTIHDSKAEVRIIQTLKHSFPDLPIIARAKHIENVKQLRNEGATHVVPEAFESSIQLGKIALRVLGASEAEIKRTTKTFRNESINIDDLVNKEAPENS